MRRLVVIVVLCAVALLVASIQPANAALQLDPPPTPTPTDGGTPVINVDGEVATGDTETNVNLNAVARAAGVSVPVTSADLGNDSRVDVLVTTGFDASADPGDGRLGRCTYLLPDLYKPDGTILSYGFCAQWTACGEERVDDIISGEFAGEDASGHYRNYLFGITGGINNPTPSAPTGSPADPTSVNDALVAAGLGDPPGDDYIPIFSWCATHSGDNVFSIPDATSTLGWGLTFDTVYDIPGDLANLFDELSADLDLYVPDVGLVPPAEQGRTFVQWPTWLFLHNPDEGRAVYSDNDIGTLRLDLRARFDRIEWAFGGDVVETCELSEMKVFTEFSDPIDDLPECHHIFTQAATADLTTTIFYTIEQRVQTRVRSTDPFPDVPWTDYLDTPTVIDLETTIEDFHVGEILALNATRDITAEQLRQQINNDS